MNSLIKIETVEELQNHWRDPYLQWWAAGMPSFNQPSNDPWKQLVVKFKTKEDRKLFSDLFEYGLTDRTSVVWYPLKNRDPNGMSRFVELLDGDKPTDFMTMENDETED